jgi:hypothetical protein
MNDVLTFFSSVVGVMNSKPIIRFVSVRDVMDFSVACVMTWTRAGGGGWLFRGGMWQLHIADELQHLWYRVVL